MILRCDSALRRHRRQEDQVAELQKGAFSAVETQRADICAAFKKHLEEAAAASEYHRKLVSDAYDKYGSLTAEWNALHDRGRTVTAAKIESFIQRAKRSRFQMSSDFQQDKNLPSRNQSAQPGATYCLSGVTQYVHIVCTESKGKRYSNTKLSRNHVFIRDEGVAGAKTCDGTLSTVAEVLFGRRAPAVPQPSRYRYSYDENGKIL